VKSVVDVDKVENCFKPCASEKSKGEGKGDGRSGGKGDGRSDGKGDGKSEGKGDWGKGGNEMEFFKCIQAKKQQCVTSSATTVQLVDATAKGGMGEHRGWWQGGERGGNILDEVLKRATECNVKDCVQAALGNLATDTVAGSASIKKAMCQARQSCPPSPSCASDRTAIRAAECKCKPQEAGFESTCRTEHPPSGSDSDRSKWAGSSGSDRSKWAGSSGSDRFKGKGDERKDDPCSPPEAPKPCA
jgi:hypothetical protein